MSDYPYHALPPQALARLAALDIIRTILSENVQLEPRTDQPGSIGPDPRATFPVTSRLLKSAAAGVAALAVEHAPQWLGDVRDEATQRLVRLGVPEASAEACVGQLCAHGVLSTVAITPERQYDLVTALLAGHGYHDGRL